MKFSVGIFISLILFVSGCGGGGSSIGGGPTQAESTLVTGVAAKGLLTINGKVDIYEVAGSTEIYRGTCDTNPADASYSKNIGSYTGVLIAKAYGSYIDESLPGNVVKSIPKESPLRAAVVISKPGDPVRLSVTPLTELAVRHALAVGDGKLIDNNVTNANQMVSGIFALDILVATPRKPDSSVLGGASPDDQCYTILLAGMARESRTTFSSLENMINTYKNDLGAFFRLENGHLISLVSSVDGFLADTTANKTGINIQNKPSNLLSIGQYPTTIVVTAKAITSLADKNANLVQFVIDLPNGYYAETKSGTPKTSGQLKDGVLQLSSGAGATPESFYNATTNTITIAILSSAGISLGELATIRLMTDPAVNPSPQDISRSLFTGATSYAFKYVYDIAGNVQETSPVNWDIQIATRVLN